MSRSFSFAPCLLTLTLAMAFAPAAHAQPQGMDVVHGSASASQAGNVFTVTTGGRQTILNWQSFGNAAGEITRFVQPDAASSVLNRVTGQSASVLLGRLESNGRVLLINPNGIVFGAGSSVDVAGLVASTLNLSNEDYLAGKFRFDNGGQAGSVVNLGDIRTTDGGQVWLIAPNVENSGLIHAPNGDVLLAAGQRVSLVDSLHPDIRIELANDGDRVRNLGQLLAGGGKVSLYGALLENRGLVSADSASRDAAGRIVLKASRKAEVGGTLSARGGQISIDTSNGDTLVSGRLDVGSDSGKGGRIDVTGERVAVLDGAVLDARGATGGGTIRVGGGWQGQDASLHHSKATVIAADATLDASATVNGDGGTVVVWSDGQTRVDGQVRARGGAQGGNGGAVETSGHELNVSRAANVGADRGRGGEWLLDPDDLTVVGTVSPPNGSGSDADPFVPSTGGSQIGASTIETALTGGSVKLQASGNIAINQSINYSGTNASKLTLDAGGGINIGFSAGIGSSGGPLSLDFHAAGSGGIVSWGLVNTNGGDVTFRADAGEIRVLRSMNLGSGTFRGSSGGDIMIGDGGRLSAGAVQLSTSSRAILDGVSAETLAIKAAGEVRLYGITVGGLAVDTAGALTIDDLQGDLTMRTLTGIGGNQIKGLRASSINLGVYGAIGSSTEALQIETGSLSVEYAYGDGVWIDSNRSGSRPFELLGVSANGPVAIHNWGAFTVTGNVSSDTSSVTLAAHSPLTIDSRGSVTAATDVSLSSSHGDPLTIDGTVSAPGTIRLSTGGATRPGGTYFDSVLANASNVIVDVSPSLPAIPGNLASTLDSTLINNTNQSSVVSPQVEPGNTAAGSREEDRHGEPDAAGEPLPASQQENPRVRASLEICR